MVRTRLTAGSGPWQVTGVVERLGTGEKRAFRTSEELLRVIEEWSR